MYILYHIEGQKNRCRYLKIHLHPKQNERAIDKTKALLTKRKLSNRFVMHPPGKVGAFSDFGILLVFDAAESIDRAKPEYCIFPGAFAVSH